MKEFRRILLEAVVVMVAGVLVAAVGYVIVRPLDIARNYFPRLVAKELPTSRPSPTTSTAVPTTGAATTSVATDTSVTPSPSQVTPADTPSQAANPVEQRLLEAGLGVIHSDEVLASYLDPAYAAGLIVFVDARTDDHYQAGHIPGAYQYDYFKFAQPPPELQSVLLAPETQKVIVYCGGGQCEDSEHAAIILAQNGVPPSNIFVYLGGWKEWVARGQPAATGADRGTPGGQ